MDKQEFEQKKQEFSPSEYMQMPVAAYMFEMEARERKERRLYNIIIALVAAIIVIVGIFLLYLNQFDYASIEYAQDVDGSYDGYATIQDGFSVNTEEQEQN